MRDRTEMQENFYKALLFFVFLGMVVPISEAQTTQEPLPQIPPVPAKYRFPSLVCGKPLPVPSTTTRDKLNELYKDCITSSCHQVDKYSASIVKNIATEVFQEPAAFIDKYENTQSGYTIFCAFFGGDNLEYVNCNYILSTVENTYEDNSCRVGNIEDEYTPVFGPNKATFVIEQRMVPLNKIPTLLGQYQARGQTFIDQSYVQRLLFAQRTRIPGLIEGPVKVQMLQDLNCDSLTATESHTLVNIDAENRLPSATVIKQEAESASETLQETESTGITMSVSDTLSSSVTSSATPNADSKSSSNILSVSLDLSQTLTPIPMPTANWLAATGIYADTTNQPNRYTINDDVITDTFSNLQWERAASNNTMSWINATDYCGNRTTGGHEGWRLPAVQELQSLVDYTIPYKGDIPGINGIAFPNTSLNAFWSATPMAGGTPEQSWYVTYGKDACFGCYSGIVYSQKRRTLSSNGYVRCVYGNVIPPVASNRYDNTSIINVVKDLVTKLMWERQASSSTMPWQTAITYCTTQTIGRFSGWRLPAVKELATLLNYNVTSDNLIMNQEIFAGELAMWYWSSTPVSDRPSDAWGVAFRYGDIGYGNVSGNGRVRCVCDSNYLPIPIANWKTETGVYEDATNQTGRYKVEDGVVTDIFSNLQWEQSNSTTPMPWSDADSYCADRTTGGHKGWRLPTVQELQSLVDYTIDYKGTIPGINITVFLGTPLNGFWSATPMAGGILAESWYVAYGKDGCSACYSGLVYSQRWSPLSPNGYIRCIYGNVIPPVTNNRYDNTSISNVVKDLVTGLMWERYASSSDLTWHNAIMYCTTQNTGKFSGWRLPAVKELLTLVNYNIIPGNLITNQEIFSGEPITWYWSSTSVSGDPGNAWYVAFGNGVVNNYDIGHKARMRCVCSGSNCLPIANWKAETGVYEDATNQTGRYRVKDGVVTDTFTNLMWEQTRSTVPMLWSNANNYCVNRTSGGHKGWRLPAVQELQSLVDYTILYKGDIPGSNITAFSDTPLNYFWSATPMSEGTPAESWYVVYGKNACSNCYSGLVNSRKWLENHNVSSNGYVRCVYGNIIPPVTNNRYNTSKANVVRDLVTGLMWERYANNTIMPWQTAITYCKSQTTGGFSDWQLPAVKELSTLLNYDITPVHLIMNQEIFSGEPATWYWSSTLVSDHPGYAWYVYFYSGYVGSNDVRNDGKVRCMRRPCFGATTQANATVNPPSIGGSQNVPAISWELCRKDSTIMNWNDANNYCTEKGGGWRLPDIYEIYALYLQRSVLGSDLDTSWYWASTPVSGNLASAWSIVFNGDVVVGIHEKSADLGVRCVRNL